MVLYLLWLSRDIFSFSRDPVVVVGDCGDYRAVSSDIANRRLVVGAVFNLGNLRLDFKLCSLSFKLNSL